DITGHQSDLYTHAGVLVRKGQSLISDTPTAEKHQVACAPLNQPARHLQANAARTAGNQVGGLINYLAALVVLRQHNLADVPGLRHVAEGVSCFLQREHLKRQRLQAAILKPAHNFLKHALNQVRLVSNHIAQKDNRIMDAWVRGLHLLVIPDAGLADLQKMAARPQHRQTGWNEIAGQRIQNDVYAFTIGLAQNLIGEIEVA